MVEPRGDTVRDRPFKRIVVENANREKEPKFGLTSRRLFCFLPDASKQRIGACDPDDPRGQTLRHDETPKLGRGSLPQHQPAAKAAAG